MGSLSAYRFWFETGRSGDIGVYLEARSLWVGRRALASLYGFHFRYNNVSTWEYLHVLSTVEFIEHLVSHHPVHVYGQSSPSLFRDPNGCKDSIQPGIQSDMILPKSLAHRNEIILLRYDHLCNRLP